MDCGGKAGAATPLAFGRTKVGGEEENPRARESGVALRFPPQSMTRVWLAQSFPVPGFNVRNRVGI